MLKHPPLADFVVSPRHLFGKAKSYNLASAIALILCLQILGFLNLVAIVHTFVIELSFF